MEEEFMNNTGEITVIKNDYSLKNEWKDLCNKYLKKFCDKHEYVYESDCWIGGDPGTIVNIGDMFISMDNIRYDIDNDIPAYHFENWYWKSLEVYELTGQNYINYQSYCNGCPDPWPESRLSSIRAAKYRVEEAQKALEDEIKNYKHNKNF